MKTSFHHLFVVGLLVSGLALAQDIVNPKSAAKPDPFVKDKGKAETKAQPTPEPPWVVPDGGIRFVFETYSMSLADFDALLAEGSKSAAMWERLQKAVTEKTATLDVVQSVVTKSGQRATTEAADELLYATEFAPTASGVLAPTAFETRPCGDRIEVDPVLSPDGKSVDLTLSIEAVRFIKWTEDKAQPPAVSSTQPLFTEAKSTMSTSLPMDQANFLGTLTQPSSSGIAEADTADKVSLVFVRPTLLPLAKSMPEKTDVLQLRLAFRTYRLDRAVAAELLRTHTDSEALLKAVQGLVKGGSAQLECLTTGTSKSGQRGSIEETAAFQYGTERAESPVSPPAIYGFKNFEMRPLGHRIEWEAVINPDTLLCEINTAPEFSEYRGAVSGHPVIEKLPEMPVFTSRKIQMSLGVALGHTAFVGTINQPRDTGVNNRKDDGKTCLQFVEIVAW